VLGPWRGLGGQALLGQLACAAAAVCYGLGITFTRRARSAGRTESGLALACAQLLCATAMLAAARALAGRPTVGPADALASLLILGVLGSGVAYALTYRIVRAAGPTTFSTVTYVIPLFSTGARRRAPRRVVLGGTSSSARRSSSPRWRGRLAA
jgi:drug/metabolite transporter (DMT)-like permease